MAVAQYREKFKDLAEKSPEQQTEFFLKRFILVLGSDWEEVPKLCDKFKKYTSSKPADDLNVTEAADFLQKNGKTRTARERNEELKDIDLDNNGRICFIEYLLLHYKVMILKEYYKVKGKESPHDFSRNGIGITGVGDIILECLFDVEESDPQIEQAIEEVIAERKVREDKLEQLNSVLSDTSKNQVVRMRAQHELLRLEGEGDDHINASLIQLLSKRRRHAKAAIKKKAAKLQNSKKEQENAEKEKLAASKGRLGKMRDMFSQNAKTDSSKYVQNERASVKALRTGGIQALRIVQKGAEKDI